MRISPAHAFRNADGFEDGRADELELINRVEPRGGSLRVSSAHPAIPDDMFVVIKGGKRVHVELEMMGGKIDFIDNALLYCLSTTLNDAILARMQKTFDADAVFEISDVAQFGRLVSDHPALAGKTHDSGAVRYVDRAPATTVDELRPVDPFEKRTAFAWQSEFRLAWFGQVTSEAFQIDVPDVVPLLRRLS